MSTKDGRIAVKNGSEIEAITLGDNISDLNNYTSYRCVQLNGEGVIIIEQIAANFSGISSPAQDCKIRASACQFNVELRTERAYQ